MELFDSTTERDGSDDPLEFLNNVIDIASDDLIGSDLSDGLFSSDSSSPDEFSSSPYYFPSTQESCIRFDLEVKDSLQIPFDSNTETPMESSMENSAPNPKKRGRPKKVAKPNESKDVSRIQMDETVLVQYTSKSYEEHVEALREERPFTFAEEQLMKSQRRRIKNRESAHNSREKKRQATTFLSSKVETIEEENQKLKENIQLLQMENRTLAETISRFESLYGPLDPIQQQQQQKQFQKDSRSPLDGMSKKQKGATILFALFFCFGLFFSKTNQNLSQQSSSFSTNRNLFEYSNKNVQNASNFVCPKATPVPYSSPSFTQSSPPPPHQFNIPNQQRESPSFNPKTEREILSEWENSTNEANKFVPPTLEFIGEFMNESNKGVTPRATPSFESFNWESLNSAPNTHHFFVNGMEQFFPPNASENLKDEPYKMNFLIPSKSLPNASQSDDRFVQILAQVVDISFLSSSQNPIQKPLATQVSIL
eukprot:TRINITY_DN4267_c1_g1_i1.p1 TRINITY_DN4267_c1_g1~~TRINITY_DN4267_c1_g1_i1.p1  ORF type:complete len:563 (-),score=247.68 TRINITY_DN4267_c1_g1_i1:1077-2522(-)